MGRALIQRLCARVDVTSVSLDRLLSAGIFFLFCLLLIAALILVFCGPTEGI